MKKLAPLLLAAALAAALPRPSHAATLAGTTFPDTFPVQGTALRLNGMALRTLTILNVRIYVAGLYVAQPSHDAATIEAAATPKVVLLQFLHEASKEQFQKEYRDGERVNCADGHCPRSAEADFERLVAAAPALKVGDTLAYVITPQGLQVLLNNKSQGTYANPPLAKQILDGFIGAHPPSPAVRQGLLGAGG